MNRGAGFIPQDRPVVPGAWESSAVRNIERSCGLKSALRQIAQEPENRSIRNYEFGNLSIGGNDE